MTTTETPPVGGTEDPNFAAFGLTPDANLTPTPPADEGTNALGEVGGNVQTATHHPSGVDPNKGMSDQEKAALQQAVQQTADGQQTEQQNGQQPEPPADPNDIGAQLTQWFQQNDTGQQQEQQQAPPVGSEGGAAGSAASGAPPSVPTFDPNAPMPMPVQGQDGSWSFPDPAGTPPVGTTIPPAMPPGQVQTQGQMSPVEQRFLQEYGRLPSGQELDALFQVQRDIARLTPEQRAQVEQAMYGQQYGQPGPTFPQQPPVPQPQPALDPFGEPDVGQVVQQQVQAALQPIQQQNAALMAQMQQDAQARADQERARLVQQIEAGAAAVKQRYNLTDQDADGFVNRVAQSGIMSGLLSAHGDGRAAMEAAMEQTMWADEAFRYRETVRTQAVAAQQQAQDEARRQKAGQLGGGSGTVPRDDAPVPTTRQERHAAMAAELGQHLAQS